MIRIHLGGTELARVRFAISPVYETVMAVDVLNRPGVHGVHLPFVRWARLAGYQGKGFGALKRLVANTNSKPGYLMPPPDEKMPTFAQELRRVRRVPEGREVAQALAHCYETLIEPHWARMQALLDADIVHRSSILASGGTQALFGALHSEVAWDDGHLLVHRSRPGVTEVRVDGHGLVICPSVFCWPNVAASTQPLGAGTLRYPARGVAALWQTGSPAPDALAGLIGRTRAAILTRLATPATTAMLAAHLGVTAGAISQHLGVLRESGLVSTQREGRAVLHMRTARGSALTG